MEVVTTSAAQTERVAARVAAALVVGDVVTVSGDLGSGKTTLVRGAVRALGHEGRVTSPTFTMVNRYDEGAVPVSHLDLYRLAETGLDLEEDALLADEIAPDRLVFVEWPDAADAALLGAVARRVTLRHAGADAREVEIA